MSYPKKNLLELKKMTLEQVILYNKELRKYEYENNIPLKHIYLRNKIHSLLVQIIKIDRLLSQDTLTVINDNRLNTTNPKIYACTHIGGSDVERIYEAIKEPAYLFLGDPKELYRDLPGLLLKINGVICLETNDLEDRKIATYRAIEVLKNNGNLMIFPEGAWNISPNLLVMGLYHGTASIALKTNADIIPVAIEQYDNHFYVSIGKNIVTSNLSNIKVPKLTNLLRDSLATEKWRIIEYQGTFDRNQVAQTNIHEFQQAIVDKCPYGFNLEDVYNTMYHEKFSLTKKCQNN